MSSDTGQDEDNVARGVFLGSIVSSGGELDGLEAE